MEVDRVTRMHAEIAESIADELKVIITPEQKKIIEKIPTSDLTAYDYYQKGREEHYDYWLKGDLGALERSEALYNVALALSYDDQLAEAYSIRGEYYFETGQPDRALREINRSIEINPNDW